MKKEIIKQKVIKNSFWSIFSAVISRIGGLIFTIILARFLFPEGYGLFSIVLSVVMIFQTFADLGINMSLVRYLAVSVEKNKKAASSYFRYLLKIKVLLSLFFGVLLLVLAYPIAILVFKNESLFLPLLVSSLYVFILSIDTFYSNVFYSADKVNYLSLREIINQALRILLVLMVFYLLKSSSHLIGIIISLMIVSVVLIFFSIFSSKKIMPEIYKKQEAKIDIKGLNKFIGYMALAGLSYMLFFYVDSLILALFLKPEFVGFYKASFSLVFGVLGFVYFTNSVFVSIFSKIKKSHANLLFHRLIKYSSIIVIPAILGILVLGRYFIRLFYGYDYLPSSLSLYFLVFILFPALNVNLILNIFFAGEKSRLFAKLIFWTSLVNIILNILLIRLFLTISPIWATAGASIAVLISWFFYFFYSVILLKKEAGISYDFKTIIKPLISGIIMSVVLVYLMYKLSGEMSVYNGIIMVTAGILVYFFCLSLMKGISKEDFSILKLIFRGKN